MEKIIESRKTLRDFYGLTLVLVPTLLMAVTSMYIGNFLERTLAQILILFLQAVIIQGMLRNKYE